MERVKVGLLAGAVLAVFSFGLFACDNTEGINDVEVWQKRLREAEEKKDEDGIEKAKLALGDLKKHWGKMVKDPSRREQSLTQLGHLRDPDTIPVLMEVWKEDPSSRRTIAKILGDIGDPSAGKILVENLEEPKGSISEKNRINGLNFTILTALGKMGYEPAKEKFIHFLKSDRSDVATAAATGLGKLGVLDPKAVEGLKSILLKEGANWMGAKKRTIISLGEMKATSALPEIVLNLWQDNGNYYPAASDALFKMGESAIPLLNETLERKNKMVEDWFAEMRKRPNGEKLFPDGTIEAKVIEVLGDQENPKAAESVYKVLEALTTELDKKGQITMIQGQMCGIAAMSVGRSRDKGYAPKLAKLMWSHKTQPAVIANFAMALTILGEKSVVPDLMKLAEEELDYNSTDSRAKAFLAATRLGGAELEGRAKALLDKVAKQAIDQSKGEFKLAKVEEFEAFVEKMEKTQEAIMKEKDVAKREGMINAYNEATASFWLANFYLDMKKNIARLEVAKKCGGKSDCLIGELKSEDLIKQDRAAWDLAASKDPKAVDALLEALNIAGKKRHAAVDPKEKYKYDSVRQTFMWALRLLAHEPEVAKVMKDKIQKQIEVETLNKESIEQIAVVVDHTLSKK